MRNSRSSVIFIHLTIAALSGCSKQPVHLDSQFSTNRLHYDAETMNSFCLISIKDVRRNKNSLGSVENPCRNVKNEYVLTWITQGLKTIGITPSNTKEIDKNTIDVEVSLIMLHIRSLESAMSCNVVLKVRFSKDNIELKHAIYRGKHTRVNWASGEGEIDDCFDRALTEALESIQADMITIKQTKAIN